MPDKTIPADDGDEHAIHIRQIAGSPHLASMRSGC
jgi:hypothetical protein